MKELNKLNIYSQLNSLDWIKLVETLEELKEIYLDQKPHINELKVDKSFEINDAKYYQEVFNKIQQSIETREGFSMQERIEMTSDISHIISFLVAIEQLSEDEYKRFRDDIYFEFIVVIGNVYLKNTVYFL